MKSFQSNLHIARCFKLIAAFLIAFSFNALLVSTVNAEEKNPLGLFKGLIGNWQIEDYSLNAKGEWQAVGGADWNFYSILNGTAIQDDWIAPSMSKPAPKQGRQFGTNIRIYNQKDQQWHMAWIANTGQKVETFNAKEKDGKIIMLGNYQGINTRITFFNVTANTFSWTMEREFQDANSKDNNKSGSKKSWRVIYKIEGSRVNK